MLYMIPEQMYSNQDKETHPHAAEALGAWLESTRMTRMPRKYTRTPHPLSVLERMQQERAGIEPGTYCAVHMSKGVSRYEGRTRVGRKAVSIGDCPRYAVHLIDGVPLCDAHKRSAS